MSDTHTREATLCLAPSQRSRRNMRSEQGFTLVEVLVAMFVLTVGILAMVNTFDSSRKLTLVAERRESIAHLAQRELERLQSVSYEHLAMASVPAHSAETTNPDRYVDYNSPVKCNEVKAGGCFAWNTEETSSEEPLVIATKGKCTTTGTAEEGCGVVSASPTGTACSTLNPFGACEWTDGRLSGDIYDFVTYHTDTLCSSKAAECPAENDYKRVTVVVTVNVPSGTHAVSPVRLSTLIANPKSSKQNPLKSAATECETAEKTIKECVSGIGKGNALSWFLHDSGAEEDEKNKSVPAPRESETHPTIAPSSGSSEPCSKTSFAKCPKPDFMDGTSPSEAKLLDYSTDKDSFGETLSLEGTLCNGVEKEEKTGVMACYGGRLLVPDVECSAEPTEVAGENSRGELWVTEPLSAESTKLTAAGGLTIYSQTLGGTAAVQATLCVAIYNVPEKIEDLAEEKPAEVAYSSYALAEWPTSMEQVAFVMEPTGEHALRSPTTQLAIKSGEIAIPQHHRIGLRVWEAPSVTMTDIAIAYDTRPYNETVDGASVEKHGYPALLQLNTE